MASLNKLLTQRQLRPLENNQEEGKLHSYTNGNIYTYAQCYFCWNAPGNGTAIIEIWGAGGSSAWMCCCGGATPGNSGSYAKKTIEVCAGSYVCGWPGHSCNNPALNFRGCSESTCICWTGANNTCGCMCAQGGFGGNTLCINTGSIYCCFIAAGYCGSQGCFTGPGCGIICNTSSSVAIGNAFGGDINCPSIVGCTTFMLGCNPCCEYCFALHHVPVPPGIISTDGAIITFQRDWNGSCGGCYANVQGIGYHQFINALNVASRNPATGFPPAACWGAYTGVCNGYDMSGCIQYFPPGVGAIPDNTSVVNYRGVGYRGGMGHIKITYLDYVDRERISV